MAKLDHRIDRRGWPAGPWDAEPDRIQWTTAAGLPGLIVRGRMGQLCGYAAVPKGHPFYERNYNLVSDLEVHGGLTYSDHCWVDGPICHEPEPGQSDDVWWLGFDCAHLFDLVPGIAALRIDKGPLYDVERVSSFSLRPDVYRDVAYVRAEVEQLAAQIVLVAGDDATGSTGDG